MADAAAFHTDPCKFGSWCDNPMAVYSAPLADRFFVVRRAGRNAHKHAAFSRLFRAGRMGAPKRGGWRRIRHCTSEPGPVSKLNHQCDRGHVQLWALVPNGQW